MQWPVANSCAVRLEFELVSIVWITQSKPCIVDAGMQLFGNCEPSLLEQVYGALTVQKKHGRVDAVTVVAAIGGVSYKTAKRATLALPLHAFLPHAFLLTLFP